MGVVIEWVGIRLCWIWDFSIFCMSDEKFLRNFERRSDIFRLKVLVGLIIWKIV